MIPSVHSIQRSLRSSITSVTNPSFVIVRLNLDLADFLVDGGMWDAGKGYGDKVCVGVWVCV